jgi:hypothetical protein
LRNYKEIINFANKKYRVQELLLQFHGIRVSPGYTFRCPYHDDGRKSAKLFEDNHFYCFAEAKQYSAYDVLKSNGISLVDIEKTIPEDYEDVPEVFIEDKLYGALAVSFSEDFKKNGDIMKLIFNWHKAIDMHRRNNGK